MCVWSHILRGVSVLENLATGKVGRRERIHLLVPFTVQQGMEGLSDVRILVERFNRLMRKHIGSRLCLESIKCRATN